MYRFLISFINKKKKEMIGGEEGEEVRGDRDQEEHSHAFPPNSQDESRQDQDPAELSAGFERVLLFFMITPPAEPFPSSEDSSVSLSKYFPLFQKCVESI